MSKVLYLASVLLVTACTVFSYFFYRDVVMASDQSLPGNCVPFNLQVKDVSRDSATVYWETSESCPGIVKYGIGAKTLTNTQRPETSQDGHYIHKAMLKNLDSGQSYYLTLESGGQVFGYKGAPVMLTTLSF